MWSTCKRCGRIHAKGFICQKNKRIYEGGGERKLRSSYKWTEKSKEIRERAHHLCEVCKAQGLITYEGLEVHHITKVKDDESLLLDDNNLICLCTTHHKQADNNEIDKDLLLELVAQRENEK